MMSGLAGDVRAFLDYCLDQNRSRKTIATYHQVLADFVAWLQQGYPNVTGIARVTRAHVQAYARNLRTRPPTATGHGGQDQEAELTVRTRAKYLAALRSMLKYFAVETDEAVLPRDKVTLPRTGDHLPKAVPTPAEVWRMLDAIPSHDLIGRRNRAILGLLFSTGMRVAELCALNRAQIREDRLGAEPILELSIIGKGSRSRIVFVNHEAQRLLRCYLDLRDDDDSALFVHTHSGKPTEPGRLKSERLTSRSIQQMVRTWSIRVGLAEQITPHSLRHGFAVDLLRGGADLRTVQDLLGHKTVTTTQIYTRLTNRALREGYLKRESLQAERSDES
jgi:site-specific recombinase XerD